MKKYSLYIITIPLAIASLVLFVWLSQKDVKNENPDSINNKSGDYFYSNEIVNSFTSEKYFVRRNKGDVECRIKESLDSIPDKCKLSAYENNQIGVCGQERFDNDPTVCDLMVRRSNGDVNFVADLLRLADPNETGIGVDEPVIGAELIEFVSADQLVTFFGYDYPDSHQGIIRAFNVNSSELEIPVISYYGEGDHSFFLIYKNNKSLLFLNEDVALDYPIKEKGIYLINEENQKIKKINFPEQYKFDDRPNVHVKVRENYQNKNTAVITVENRNYTFDFNKEIFVK